MKIPPRPAQSSIETFLLDLHAALSSHPWMSIRRTQRVVEEVRTHLEDSVATLLESGQTPQAAADEALSRFGSVNVTRLALTRINDRWTFMLLRLATGTAAAITGLMAAAIFVFSAAGGESDLYWSNIIVSALVIDANLVVLFHLFFRALRGKIIAWLGGTVMALGLFITAASSLAAIRGPDPEYWIVMMGLLLVGEAAALLLSRFSSRLRAA